MSWGSTLGLNEKYMQNFYLKSEGRNTRPRRRLEDNFNVGLKETGWRLWTGFSWPRIGTGGGLL